MTGTRRTAAAPPGHRSRRSSVDVENAILAATLEVLDEVGFEDLTVEAVATHAGAAKTAVYRRWPSKVPLVVEALVRSAPMVDAPDTGDLHQDILGLWENVATGAARSIERLLPLVITYLGDEPEMTAQLRDRYFEPRRRAGRSIIERAAARGEISPTVDPDLAFDLLFGPIVYRFLLGLPIDDETIGRLTDLAIEGLRSSSPSGQA
jgi:AcrR family transcriptional regulator